MKKQQQRILQYLDDFGSITQMDALRDLGIMRLASRVSELRKAGYPIVKQMEGAENRYGEKVSFARYSMGVRA